jgi:hypothetical protein
VRTVHGVVATAGAVAVGRAVAVTSVVMPGGTGAVECVVATAGAVVALSAVAVGVVAAARAVVAAGLVAIDGVVAAHGAVVTHREVAVAVAARHVVVHGLVVGGVVLSQVDRLDRGGTIATLQSRADRCTEAARSHKAYKRQHGHSSCSDSHLTDLLGLAFSGSERNLSSPREASVSRS